MSKLTYIKNEAGTAYTIEFKNKEKLGSIILDVNGYWYWWPRDYIDGIIDAWVLKDLYTKLEELNKPWEDYINKHIPTGRLLSTELEDGTIVFGSRVGQTEEGTKVAWTNGQITVEKPFKRK